MSYLNMPFNLLLKPFFIFCVGLSMLEQFWNIPGDASSLFMDLVRLG